jgi:hypothetical protein
MKSSLMEDRFIAAGWRHEEIDQQHFRIRPTCRECLVKETEAREVWGQIEKERKAADSFTKGKDEYMSMLVGAEADTSADESDYWKSFTE